MKRREAERLATLLRTAGGRTANGLADRLLNAGGDAARDDISELVADHLSPPSTPKPGLPGEIPFNYGSLDRYAVTMSESGQAEIVEATTHLEALRKVNPLLLGAGGEWPEHDDATVFLQANGATFSRDIGHEGFLREYGSVTSSNCPVWDESKGAVMALKSEELIQWVLVYPIIHVDLPTESDPLAGWEGGLADKYLPKYGRWSKRRPGFYLLAVIEKCKDRQHREIPTDGFTYRWVVMIDDARPMTDIARGENLPDAAAAQRAAEAALDRYLAADRD